MCYPTDDICAFTRFKGRTVKLRENTLIYMRQCMLLLFIFFLL